MKNLHDGEAPLRTPKPNMSGKPPAAHIEGRDKKGGTETFHREQYKRSSAPKEENDSANGERAKLLGQKLHEKLAEVDPEDFGKSFKTAEKIMSAAEELREFLFKSEGSRGGHIIGHTKSGKPVYASGGKTGGFSPKDHRDAAELHAKNANSHHKQATSLADEGPPEDQESDDDYEYQMGYDFHDKKADHHRVIAGRHTDAASKKKAASHLESKDKKSKTTEKSMRSQAADELKYFLSKASGGLPTIETPDTGDIYASEVNGGPFNGPQTGSSTSRSEGYPKDAPKSIDSTPCKNSVKGRTDGDSKSEGYPDDVPNPPEISDWHQAKQLNRNQLERSQTGTSLQATQNQVAHEAALQRQAMRKSMEGEDVVAARGVRSPRHAPQPEMRKSREVQHGLITYVDNGTDQMASEMLKSGHYFGGAQPNFIPNQRSRLNTGVLCKSCDATHSAMYTACPSCGAGTTMTKSFVNCTPVQQGFHGMPQAMPGGLQPNLEGDVYVPTLSRRGKE